MNYYPNREAFKVLACGCIGQWPVFQGGAVQRIICEDHPADKGQVVVREASADDKLEYITTGTVTLGTDIDAFDEMQTMPRTDTSNRTRTDIGTLF